MNPLSIVGDRAIANFSFAGTTNLHNRLQLRAIPNTRLIRAFHLENSFTTSDVYVHRNFLKKASQAIRLIQTEDWVKLGTITQTSLDLCLKHFKDGLPYVPLASLIRVVSFSVMLHVLFGVDPLEINLDEARKATDAINRLWVQSKDKDFIPSLYDRTVLNNALEILLPAEYPCEASTNPLNLIMPAYETLWRVVLLTFVSIAYQTDDPKTTEELQEAVRNVPQCFCQGGELEMKALAIAKEGLRLYPPTKRIYRARLCVSPRGEKDPVTADVERWHRDSRVWGATAGVFDPQRFHPRGHERDREDNVVAPTANLQPTRQTLDYQRIGYFPFGVGRHMCPAAAGFGERIITLLVVELTRRLGDRQTGLKIYFNNTTLQKATRTLLPSGRSDMENWVLELPDTRAS
ncbi:cytochrome P450 [Xylaria bambusicola]|uniref:cytochrome P450 n=1 Tax=Xylaria bambusicola TaxID=326684 RepID=UPI0020073E37|nr:cytochrome P450 [Xylaria bambusicola]KAI0509059.1 cytochrome P450 [Xylaria bambusicola]